MANIAAVLEKTEFEALPEGMQEYFTEKDNKFYPNISQTDVERLAVGLKKNRDEILAEKRELEKQVKPYMELGTIEEIQLRLDEATKGDSKDVEAIRKEYDDKIKALAEKSTATVEKLQLERDQEKASLTSHIEQNLLASAINEALAETGGSPRLLAPVIRQNLKVIEAKADDGSPKFEIQVLDKDGKPQYADALGTLKTVGDYAKELQQDKEFAPAFSANNGGGSGANPNQHQHTTGNIMKRSDWNALPPIQQRSFVDKVKAGEGKLID